MDGAQKQLITHTLSARWICMHGMRPSRWGLGAPSRPRAYVGCVLSHCSKGADLLDIMSHSQKLRGSLNRKYRSDSGRYRAKGRKISGRYCQQAKKQVYVPHVLCQRGWGLGSQGKDPRSEEHTLGCRIWAVARPRSKGRSIRTKLTPTSHCRTDEYCTRMRGNGKPRRTHRRIGEAKNPGPSCKLVTANITSFETGGVWALAAEADVLIIQETKLSAWGSNDARRRASKAGWNSHFVPGYITDKGQIGGGVAILVKQPRKLVPSKDKLPHSLKGRFGRAAVTIGPRDIVHIGAVYGFDGSKANADILNAELHEYIFGAVNDLGSAQWIVGGDWNVVAEDIHYVGRPSLVKNFLPRAGPDFGTCFPGGRRIDFFVASQSLRGTITQEVTWEEECLPTHRPVSVEFPSDEANFTRTTLQMPKVVEIEVSKQQVTEGSEQMRHDTQWEWTLARTKAEKHPYYINKLWEMWNEQAEGAIRTVQSSMNAGRGQAAKFVQEPMANRRQDPLEGAVSSKYLQKQRAYRRALTITRLFHAGKGDTEHYDKTYQNLVRKNQEYDFGAGDVPPAHRLEEWAEAIRLSLEAQAADAKTERRKAFSEWQQLAADREAW